MDTDEEQLHRVFNAASLPPGEKESISAMLFSVLEQKNKHICQLNLKVANATKDNVDYLMRCRTQLSVKGCSEDEVTKILGDFVAI